MLKTRVIRNVIRISIFTLNSSYINKCVYIAKVGGYLVKRNKDDYRKIQFTVGCKSLLE